MTQSTRSWTKATSWNGKDLKGTWEFTLKIDGVRAFFTRERGWFSRNGKPLYNIPTVYRGDGPMEGCEVYCSKPGRSSKENYKATIKCVRAKTKARPIRTAELYSLGPLDHRLVLQAITSPNAGFIRATLASVVAQGYEGLVLREVGGKGRWLKVKPTETYDVRVTDIIEGTGKHKGRMGALMTEMGKVGTGFSDEERKEWWGFRRSHASKWPLIEVSCMQLTPAGKFRHPRFERIRYDK